MRARMLSVLSIGVLNNGMILTSVSTFNQLLAERALLIIAVVVQEGRKRGRVNDIMAANLAKRVPSPPHLELASPAGDGGKIHEAVVRTIAQRVLGGQYLPEAALPREDELAEEFGVSRTSVREAIKVLSAKGLIETRQRIGVRVRPRDEWRLLDPAVLSWHPNISQDEELLTGLLEARRLIEPAAAEMAAARANSKDLVAIETAYLGMERSLPHDILACCEADVSFHRAVLYASHNIVLRGLAGTIDAALRAAFLITSELTLSQTQTLHVHLEVFESIRMRDAAAARSATNSLLDTAEADIRKAVPAGQRSRR